MDSQLFEYARCPITRSPLAPAPESLLEAVNTLAESGKLTNRIGQTVEEPLEQGLINEARSFMFPVKQGIPTLIADEAIDLSGLADQDGGE